MENNIKILIEDLTNCNYYKDSYDYKYKEYTHESNFLLDEYNNYIDERILKIKEELHNLRKTQEKWNLRKIKKENIKGYFKETIKYFEERYKNNNHRDGLYMFSLDTHRISKDKNDCIDFHIDILVYFYDYLKEYELTFMRDDDAFEIKIDFTKSKEDNLKEVEIKRKIFKSLNKNLIPWDYLDISVEEKYYPLIKLYSTKNYFLEEIDSWDNCWDGEKGCYSVAFWLKMNKGE